MGSKVSFFEPYSLSLGFNISVRLNAEILGREYLVVEIELAESGDVLCPLNHDHQLLLHRLTNVLHRRRLLLICADRVHCHTHLHAHVYIARTLLVD